MIATLSGKILARFHDRAVVDVHGVGYELNMSSDSLSRIPEVGEDAFFHVHTNVREDAITLYGFLAEEEKELFGILKTVSGIGPKLALAILSGLRVEPLCVAIVGGDVKLLTTLQGVGKKTAERICVELKEKVAHLAVPAGAVTAPQMVAKAGPKMLDAISALTNLGYSDAQARAALAKVKEARGEQEFAALTVEDLIREGLRSLV